MEVFATILSPLSAALGAALGLFFAGVGDWGFSIILLALCVNLALSPVTAFARRLEIKNLERSNAMAPLIAEAKNAYRGREQFEKIDEIYQRFGYHPIEAMGAVLPLLVQLPFLLAALFLLAGRPALEGTPFLFIADLGAPDGALALGGFHVNALPILMTAITVTESRLRPEATPASKTQFLIVAAVLFALIYSAPAGVCLYWLSANAASFARTMMRRAKGEGAPRAVSIEPR